MAEERLEIIITGESKAAQDALRKAGIQVEGIKKKTAGAKGVLENFKKNWVGITAALGTATLLIKKSFDFTKTFLDMRQGMDALARNTGQNSDIIIDKLREVSKGTIANRDLVLAANRSVALNVTKDVGQMAQLLDIARVKAKAMGITTTQAFNDIVTGIGRGSPLILDNLGIITKGWDEEAKAAGMAMDQQFILNKILAQGAIELERTGAKTLTAAEKMQQMSAAMENAKESIGKAMSVAVLPVIEAFTKLIVIFTGLPDSIKLFGIIFVATMTTAIAITKLFGITLTAATGGVSLLIGALVAGSVLVVTHWEDVVAFFEKAWTDIKVSAEQAWTGIKIAMLTVALLATKAFTGMVNGIITAINFVIEGINLLPGVQLEILEEMTANTEEHLANDLLLNQQRFAELNGMYTKNKKSHEAMLKPMVKNTQTAAATMLAAFVDSIKNTKSAFADLNKFAKLAADQMVDSIVDNIETMKSSSKQVFAAIVLDFGKMIAGMLKVTAKEQALEAIKAFAKGRFIKAGLHTAAAAAFTAGAGIVKALAGSAAAAISAAEGADFTTSGPQLMMVGDNPSGKEHVTVTPEEGGGVIGGGINIENMTVIANNPEELMEELALNTGTRLLPR